MRRRRRSMPSWILALLLLAAGALGVALILNAQGRIDLASIFDRTEEAPTETRVSHEGLVPIPICHRPIPAYTKIRRDHLWDPAQKTFHYFYMKKEQIPAGVMTTIAQIRGRVLKHEKRNGFVFSEEDFYPKGTREGLVAGIPPGKRSLRVTTAQIEGLHELRAGDCFDVIATHKVDAQAGDLQKADLGGGFANLLAFQAKMSSAFQKANVAVVVRGGLVIQPVRLRAQPTTSSSLTRGATVRTIPVQEMVIALAPDEATQLAQAIATDASIWCLARSGRPDDTGEETNDLRVPSPLDMLFGNGGEGAGGLSIVERIQGAERVRVAIPRSERPTRKEQAPDEALKPASHFERQKEGK